eukprot:TRINITY_DN11196_c0_g1_i1.p1 TRINITY_DN11196_c0_g1~~TRINITY_DN11196_c0_g1_i1.p1  ORF type:complete len:642 (+),score=76.45 TRINITY_DN11196_c0_g1_i1:145-2070(+)
MHGNADPKRNVTSRTRTHSRLFLLAALSGGPHFAYELLAAMQVPLMEHMGLHNSGYAGVDASYNVGALLFLSGVQYLVNRWSAMSLLVVNSLVVVFAAFAAYVGVFHKSYFLLLAAWAAVGGGMEGMMVAQDELATKWFPECIGLFFGAQAAMNSMCSAASFAVATFRPPLVQSVLAATCFQCLAFFGAVLLTTFHGVGGCTRLAPEADEKLVGAIGEEVPQNVSQAREWFRGFVCVTLVLGYSSYGALSNVYEALALDIYGLPPVETARLVAVAFTIQGVVAVAYGSIADALQNRAWIMLWVSSISAIICVAFDTKVCTPLLFFTVLHVADAFVSNAAWSLLATAVADSQHTRWWFSVATCSQFLGTGLVGLLQGFIADARGNNFSAIVSAHAVLYFFVAVAATALRKIDASYGVVNDELRLHGDENESLRFLHRHIELRESVIHGRGLFVVKPIRKGEVVYFQPLRRHGQPQNFVAISDVLDRGDAWGSDFVKFAFQVSDTHLYGVDVSAVNKREDAALFKDASLFQNHSCDPTTGLKEDHAKMVALRDLMPGTEVTYDYATTESCQWPWCKEGWECNCGASNCRRRVRYDDWTRRSLQQKHGLEGFAPDIRRKILGGAEPKTGYGTLNTSDTISTTGP